MIQRIDNDGLSGLLAMIEAKAPQLMRTGALVSNSGLRMAPPVTAEQRLAMRAMLRGGATTEQICNRMNLSATCVRRHTAETRRQMREARA